VQTANVWIDRSGQAKEFHVHLDTYSPEIVEEATRWLDDVAYALMHDETAQKEPPRTWCEKVCGHFADCRGLDTDVEGLITDPSLLTAVDIYNEGTELEKLGKRMKDEAKATLAGVRGSTGEFSVRWTKVGPSEVSFTRGAHERLNIQRVK
jgi:hypothetical protein